MFFVQNLQLKQLNTRHCQEVRTLFMYVNYMCERDVFGCVLINPGVLLCHRLKKRRRSRIGWWVQCLIYYM